MQLLWQPVWDMQAPGQRDPERRKDFTAGTSVGRNKDAFREMASQETAVLDLLSGFVKSNGGPARSYRDASEWWIIVVFLCSNKRLGDRLENVCAYSADAETEAPILWPPDVKK